MNNGSICIIGHFGGSTECVDGQTIKTKNIYAALESKIGVKIDCVDTYYLRKRPIFFFYKFLVAFWGNKKIVVLLSRNGRKFIFPFLYVGSIFLKKEIYHYSIGGNIAKEANEYSRIRKYMAAFKYNWVESHSMEEQLQKLGMRNAVYLPNFKRIKLCEEIGALEKKDEFMFCTFSRVCEEKGIGDAIEAVTEINRSNSNFRVLLDVYGPIEPKYNDEFYRLIDASSGACKYCGIIHANQSVNVIKDYYMMLFPTKWEAEGMPGTIIDALSAAVPVLTSCWPYCNEMLVNGETAFIYEWKCQEMLAEKIVYAVNHVDEVAYMKTQCLKEAIKYSEEVVLDQILFFMEIKN